MSKANYKNQQNPHALYEVSAERIVLTGLLRMGEELYYEINTFLFVHDFHAPENQLIYDAISDLVVKEKNPNPSVPAILSVISKKQPGAITEFDLQEYLGVLVNTPINKDEAISFAKKVGRLSWARQAVMALKTGAESVYQISGDEPLTEILAKAETPLLDLANKSLQSGDIVDLREEVDKFIDNLVNAPPTALGISTGFSRLDIAIGGLRFGVHLLGARTKQGKSHLALAIGDNVAAQGIPVLYLDTEMDETSTLTRRAARFSQTEINDLESKKFLKSEGDKVRVRGAIQKLKQLPFHYYNISGKSHQEWISVMRRWLFKTVGFDSEGKAKPCLIILDYIKTMNLGELGDTQEYQYLGQIATDLHNFARKYHLPIFAMVQLNRDGLTNSGQGVFAGSDRIAWLCSTLMIFRKKEDADFADDPPTNGNRKLEVIDCRFGPGLQPGEYINIHAHFGKSTIVEGKTNLENRSAAATTQVRKTPVPI